MFWRSSHCSSSPLSRFHVTFSFARNRVLPPEIYSTFAPSNEPHNFIGLSVNLPGTFRTLIFSLKLSGVLPKMEPFFSCWLLKPTSCASFRELPLICQLFAFSSGFGFFNASRIEVVRFSGHKLHSSTFLPNFSTFYLLTSAPSLRKFSCGGSDSENTHFRWSWMPLLLDFVAANHPSRLQQFGSTKSHSTIHGRTSPLVKSPDLRYFNGLMQTFLFCPFLMFTLGRVQPSRPRPSSFRPFPGTNSWSELSAYSFLMA